MQLDLGNGPVELEVSFWTLVVYETQFGGDMIGDLFGEVTYAKDDEPEEVGEPTDGDEPVAFTIDYSAFDWNSGVKAMWAAAKAANPGTPAYEQWCRGMHDVNMWPLMESLKSEVIARLFRPGAAISE